MKVGRISVNQEVGGETLVNLLVPLFNGVNGVGCAICSHILQCDQIAPVLILWRRRSGHSKLPMKRKKLRRRHGVEETVSQGHKSHKSSV